MKSNLNENKLSLLRIAAEEFGTRDFAELGAVGDVMAGYTFWAANNLKGVRGTIVDKYCPDGLTEEVDDDNRVRMVQGRIGHSDVVRRTKRVDTVVFFDILLHMVDPSWDEVLKLHCDGKKVVVVYNPMNIADKTVRLTDLSLEEFENTVPFDPNVDSVYSNLLKELANVKEERDVEIISRPSFWQWAIGNTDLLTCMDSLGFKVMFEKECGPIDWRKGDYVPKFNAQGYIFARK